VDGVLIKHPPETLRGILKGKINADGFERNIMKLGKRGTK
jgi:hypothetical protein